VLFFKFYKVGPSWWHHSVLQKKKKNQFHLNVNKHATNLQETISVSEGAWKVGTIDDYSPSKYNPGVSFNHFPNGPRTFKIKEQNINSNHCFERYCQYFLVTKMDKLNEHKTKFYKVQQIYCNWPDTSWITLYALPYIFVCSTATTTETVIYWTARWPARRCGQIQCFCTEVNGNEYSS